jgi:outer membrane lipoprotein-sorting protein
VPRVATVVLASVLVLALGGCAARRLSLPSGTGEPFPGFAAAFDEATGTCRAIDTMTAELGVSGRVEGQRLRGRVITGFSRPSRLRLEGLAPFGPPAFILVSAGERATLLLPRDPAVLEGEPAEAIIDALVGIPLAPATLHAILAGCGLDTSRPVGGFSFTGGWLRVDGEDGSSSWLQQGPAGRWAVQAALAGSLRVEYEARAAGTPRRIRLELEDAQPPTELRLQVAEADLNVRLGDEAFSVKVPRGATSITLAELRRAGPLGR